MIRSITRSVSVLVLASIVLALAITVLIGPAGAQTEPVDGDPTTTFQESDGMIPRPNSGVEPEDAGDRGGALQSVVFVIVLVGVGVIGTLVVRESRKARARRGF